MILYVYSKNLLTFLHGPMRTCPVLTPTLLFTNFPLDPTIPPIKQKPRRLRPEWSLKLKEEIQKQLDAGFLLFDFIPSMVSKHCPHPQKGWKGPHVY